MAALTVITIAILCTFPVVMTVLVSDQTMELSGVDILHVFLWSRCLSHNMCCKCLNKKLSSLFNYCFVYLFWPILIAIPPVLEYAADNWGGGIADILGSLGTWSHYTEMKRGVISLANVVFYLSLVGFCLF